MSQFAVIVGSRHRNYQEGIRVQNQPVNEGDQQMLRELLLFLSQHYGKNLVVASISCDMGIGWILKNLCRMSNVKFVEFLSWKTPNLDREEYEMIHLARHASLVEVGQEFHLFMSHARSSHMEDLLKRIKSKDKPFTLYNEENQIFDHGNY